MNDLDACRPSLLARCPIDVAVLTRWFLEDNAEPGGAGHAHACADAVASEEAAV